MIFIPESLIPYLVILFNAIVFWFTRRLLLPITPRKFRIIIHELISTIELCSGCSELGECKQSSLTEASFGSQAYLIKVA